MANQKDEKESQSVSATNLYQRMIEEIQDYAIILLNKEGVIQNWNKGAQTIKGYFENEITGKHFSIFYFDQDLKNNLPQQLLNQATKEGRAIHEGWRKRKDNSRFWGSITITAVHDDDNNIIGFCKVTRDLTDKKLADDELKMSEERYHQMVAEVQDYAIILLNPHGIIQNWNLGAEKIKGYTEAEAVGNSFEMFYTSSDRQSGLPAKLLQLAKETGKATQEGWRVRKDGTRFWGTIIITALHGKNGEIIGFSKVTRDLTDKKLADDKIIAYTAELEMQNKELEQFAYVASHDLQEPLRKIQTFGELIQENYDDRKFVTSYFAKLDSSAQRMADLVKSLLDYSRISKDKGEEVAGHEFVDLNHILNDITQDFELLIEERKATIKYHALPIVRGNPMQLGQLFSNLISNSLKFCTANPVIRISAQIVNEKDIPNAVDTLQKKQYYHILFEDNGIGFEQKYDKIIFSLFQRLHGKQEYVGTGIGLALCKRIAENHNGMITATSELGKGSKFNVYLPVNQPD
jgi:PAS domain S-box-containing protein